LADPGKSSRRALGLEGRGCPREGAGPGLGLELGQVQKENTVILEC